MFNQLVSFFLTPLNFNTNRAPAPIKKGTAAFSLFLALINILNLSFFSPSFWNPVRHPAQLNSDVTRLSPVPTIEYCTSEIELIKEKLQTFKFDDNGEPSLLKQQLNDYNKLRDQLKAAVQVGKFKKNQF